LPMNIIQSAKASQPAREGGREAGREAGREGERDGYSEGKRKAYTCRNPPVGLESHTMFTTSPSA
jgi:hypothetical protein